MIPFETKNPCYECGKINYRRYGKICGTCYNHSLKNRSQSYQNSLRVYNEKRLKSKRDSNAKNKTCIVCHKKYITGYNHQKRCADCKFKRGRYNKYIRLTFLKSNCMVCSKKFVPIRTKQFCCTPKCYTRFYGTVRNREKKSFYERVRDGRIRANGGTFSFKQWQDLKEKYKNRCASCHSVTELTIDHIVPVSKGGSNLISNIQPLCRKCNSIKGAKYIKYDIQHLERETA